MNKLFSSVAALCLGTAFLGLGPAIATAAPILIFATDFTGALPSELSGITTTESATAVYPLDTMGFGGNMLVNKSFGNPAAPSTLTLNGLPAHTAIDLGFLMSPLRSWDGLPPHCCAPDFFNVLVDGVSIFSEALYSSGPGPFQTYNPGPSVYLGGGSLGAPTPPVYNMAFESAFQNIAHNDTSVTIRWFANGAGWQGGDDEHWAIDNLRVSVVPSVPEPGLALLVAGGLATAISRVRGVRGRGIQ